MMISDNADPFYFARKATVCLAPFISVWADRETAGRVIYMNYLEEYIYRVVLEKIDILDKWMSAIAAIDDCEKVAVWGATKSVEYLLKFTDLRKKQVTYVDRSKTAFQGRPVFKPAEINLAEYPYVLVGAFNYQREIIDELTEKYHYKGVIINSYSSCDELPFWQSFVQNRPPYKPGIVRSGDTIHDPVLAVIVKIIEIRKIVSSIGKEAKVGIYGDEKHLHYLQKFTDLPYKNACCLLDDSVSAANSLHCENPPSIQNMDLDVVIIAKLKDSDTFLGKIQDKYTGKIINFYTPESKNEFYECVFSDSEEQQSIERDAIFSVANTFCEEISQTGNYFLNFTVYNKFSDDSPPNYYYGTDWRYNDSAIIIQGLIEYTDDFTYHTILQYLKMFPGVNIVVSTWEESAKKGGFAKIESIPGIHIVICDEPTDPGLFNTYLQMQTTFSGLKYAKDHLNIEYALKIRSDSRLYSCEALEFMKFFSDYGFDPKEVKSLKGKIVCDIKFDAKAPDYHKKANIIADYWNFGHIDDMLKFWNPAVIENNAAYRYIGEDPKGPETFLYTRHVFAYTALQNPEETSLIPWEHFYGFLPMDAIDFMWNKYNYMSSGWRHFAAASNVWHTGIRRDGLSSWVEWLKTLVEVERNKK